MKIEIHSAAPTALLTKIKKDIHDDTLKTWDIVLNTNNDEFLTHTPEQWFEKALLKPSIATIPARLILTVDWFKTSIPDEYTKGFYIGRFTEVLLEHYPKYFSKLETFA